MPDPRDFLTVLRPDRLAMMQQPTGPSGLAGLLARPGMNEGLLSFGLNMLASDQKRETFGQSLLRSVGAGAAAYEEKKGDAKYNTFLNSQDMPEQMRGVLKMIGRREGLPIIAQNLAPQAPEEYTLGPHETRFRGATPIAQGATPEAADNRPADVRTMEWLAAQSPEVQASYRELFGPSPGVTINTGDVQPRAQEEYWGTRYSQIQQAAEAATGNMARLNEMATLAEMPEVYQGAGGEGVLRIKELGAALGMDVQGVAESQALKAVANEMALELRNPAGGAGMPGAMSDKDREFLVSMVPRLTNTPEGNALIIAARARLAQRQLDVAQFADEYAAANGGRLDGGFTAALRQRYASQEMFADLQTRAAQATGTRPNPLRLPERP